MSGPCICNTGCRGPALATLHDVVATLGIAAGCSKTTLARAAASASKATFLTLSGAQLWSMYVGEGEALLRATFQRARLASPAILFLDEVDALAGDTDANETLQ